jgi:transposase
MHVADHLGPDELGALAADEPAKRPYLRIRAVILAVEGRTAVAISRALGCSRRAVQNWIAAYNAAGSESSHDRPRPGRPKFFPDRKLDELRARLDAGPRPGDGVCTLRARDIRVILREEFGVLYTLPGLYDFLHRIGYAYLDPRPVHVRSDPVAQEEFKKKSPLSSTRSPSPTPARGSRSGSRTRPGSGRRGR